MKGPPETPNPLDSAALSLRLLRGEPLIRSQEVPQLRWPVTWPPGCEEVQHWHDLLLSAYTTRTQEGAQEVERRALLRSPSQITHRWQDWMDDRLGPLEVTNLLYATLHTQLSGALGRPSLLPERPGDLSRVTVREYPLIIGHNAGALNYLLMLMNDLSEISLNTALSSGRGQDSLDNPQWAATLTRTALHHFAQAPLDPILLRVAGQPVDLSPALMTRPHHLDDWTRRINDLATALWRGHRVRGSLRVRTLRAPTLSLRDQATIMRWRGTSENRRHAGYDLLRQLHSFALLMLTADQPRNVRIIKARDLHMNGLPLVATLLRDERWDAHQGPHGMRLSAVADAYLA